ncbi:MAG: hypothetical protein C4K58_02965 [Flavobacteriaceae bacterium]|nr:MAG: hypothetical protein C4K58_02965 [Flavobacteriaceae bacterium]
MFKFFENHFGSLLIFFGIIAYFFPFVFSPAKDIAAELLMFSLFLSGLKIKIEELVHLKQNKGKIVWLSLVYVVFLPLAFYLLTFFLDYHTRLGAFLIVATSGAVMSPLLASFYRLKILWTTAFVVITACMVPFTIPFLVKNLFDANYEVSMVELCVFLAKMVFVPSLLAFLVRRYFPNFVQKALPFTGGIGSMNMILFLSVLVSSNQATISQNLQNHQTLLKLGLMFFVFLSLYLVGYLVPAQDKEEKWTNCLMFGNMNNGLVVLLSSEFFPPEVMFMTLVSIVPWSFSQPIFKFVFQKYFK